MSYKQSRLLKRNGTYYIRVALPRWLFSIAKKKEIRYSLRTKDYRTALIKCREQSYKIDLWIKNMKVKEDNSLELNSTDLGIIQLDRLEEIEKERRMFLKYGDGLPENEIGLFNKERFDKWIADDPEYPERKANLEDKLEYIEGTGIQVSPALSNETPDFREEVVLEWFKKYIGKVVETDNKLPIKEKEIMKGIVDGSITLKLCFQGGKKGALSHLMGAILPLEKYAIEKATADLNKIPYQPDDEVSFLLRTLDDRKREQLATAKIGQKTEKTHWKTVWDALKERKIVKGQKKKTIQTSESRLKNIFKILGKEYLEDITVDDCDNLCVEIYKQKWGRSGENITARTVLKYLEEFKYLIREARKRDLSIIDVRDLIALPTKEEIEKGKKEQRVDFNENDLNTLFGCKEFIETRYDMKYFPKFWVPLICLYSGCRQNEIAQIEFDNIKKSGNIHYFNITNTGYLQSLKNVHSKRLVPIHSKLIELGFLDVVKKIKKAKKYRKNWIERDSKIQRRNSKGMMYCNIHNPNGVFFTLTYTNGNGYAKTIGDFINNNLLPKLGLKITKNKFDDTIQKLVFHCFRHTTSSNLVSNDMSDTRVDKLLGWKVDAQRGTYTHIKLAKMKEDIEKISYPSFEKKTLPKLMPDPEKEKTFFVFDD